MQNTKRLLSTLTLTSFLTLAGCSFPGVYKIDVQQGNVITQDMIDQLRPGMSTNQVRYVMGNPLVQDTFNPNRWDYIYSLKPGGHTRQQERISLLFNQQGQLIALAGDFKPGLSRDEEILQGQPNIAETPATTLPEAGDQDNTNELPIISREQLEQQESKPETPAAPGSLLEELQQEIDAIEIVPVPEPGKIGH